VTVVSKAMQRARRAARAVIHGDRILEYMTSRAARKLLVSAAEAGQPPVASVSHDIERIAKADSKLAPVKQFAGLCIRAVLQEEGFEVAETGVRLSNDRIFRTGAVYRKAAAQPNSDHDLLRRFLATLTDEEAAFALGILTARQVGAERLNSNDENTSC
jgi:hypothetical protein